MDLQWNPDDLAWGEELRRRLNPADGARVPGEPPRRENDAILAAVAPARGRAIGDPARAMVAMRELGRALATEPDLETFMMAAHLVAAGRYEAPVSLVGEPGFAAVAWQGAGSDDPFPVASTSDDAAGSGWRIRGVVPVVIGADGAANILVGARCTGTAQVFCMAADTPGLACRSFPTIDGRQAAELTFDSVRAEEGALIAEGAAAERAMNLARSVATALACARAVGMMRYLVDATVDYLRGREQFGEPLARFQALQHRAVDMLIEAELAESAALRALLSFDLPHEERELAVAAAKATAASSARFVGQNAIQLHGGKGMDSRTPATGYFRALTAFELSYGSASRHLERVAELTLN